MEQSRQPASKASWAGGGILSPLRPWLESESVCRLVRASQVRTHSLLLEHAAVDVVEYWQCGMLVRDPEPGAAVWAAKQNVDHRQDACGLLLPAVAQLRTPRFGRFVAMLVQQAGVRLRTGMEVTGVEPAVHGARVRTPGGWAKAELVIVCAGAWSGKILAGVAGGEVPTIEPVRGQMIAIDGTGVAPDTIVQSGATYLVPRRDGLVLVGSTLEHAGFDEGITREARQALHDAAISLWPGLRGRAVVAQWAGLRPQSSSGAPVIGPHPGSNRIWINTGHFRNGVTLAAGSAVKLAEDVSEAFGDA